MIEFSTLPCYSIFVRGNHSALKIDRSPVDLLVGGAFLIYCSLNGLANRGVNRIFVRQAWLCAVYRAGEAACGYASC